MGSVKAAVFPEPVLAKPIRSIPFIIAGIAWPVRIRFRGRRRVLIRLRQEMLGDTHADTDVLSDAF